MDTLVNRKPKVGLIIKDCARRIVLLKLTTTILTDTKHRAASLSQQSFFLSADSVVTSTILLFSVDCENLCIPVTSLYAPCDEQQQVAGTDIDSGDYIALGIA